MFQKLQAVTENIQDALKGSQMGGIKMYEVILSVPQIILQQQKFFRTKFHSINRQLAKRIQKSQESKLGVKT